MQLPFAAVHRVCVAAAARVLRRRGVRLRRGALSSGAAGDAVSVAAAAGGPRGAGGGGPEGTDGAGVGGGGSLGLQGGLVRRGGRRQHGRIHR